MITIQETTTITEIETELAKIGAQMRVYQVDRGIAQFDQPIDPAHRWAAMLTSINGVGRATFASGVSLFEAVQSVFTEHRASIRRALKEARS